MLCSCIIAAIILLFLRYGLVVHNKLVKFDNKVKGFKNFFETSEKN